MNELPEGIRRRGGQPSAPSSPSIFERPKPPASWDRPWSVWVHRATRPRRSPPAASFTLHRSGGGSPRS